VNPGQQLSLIVAMTAGDRVIGRAGGLPWRLSADLKRFKQLTMGHHIVMGRKTYDSIGRALPGRTTVVISRQPALSDLPEGVKFASSLDAGLAAAGNDPEVFVIGGGEIFRAVLPLAQRAYVTWVDAEIDGDTFFPEFPGPDWRLVSEDPVAADEKNEFPSRFCVYERAR
jgi:dihydrofolate reductase